MDRTVCEHFRPRELCEECAKPKPSIALPEPDRWDGHRLEPCYSRAALERYGFDIANFCGAQINTQPNKQ